MFTLPRAWRTTNSPPLTRSCARSNPALPSQSLGRVHPRSYRRRRCAPLRCLQWPLRQRQRSTERACHRRSGQRRTRLRPSCALRAWSFRFHRHKSFYPRCLRQTHSFRHPLSQGRRRAMYSKLVPRAWATTSRARPTAPQAAAPRSRTHPCTRAPGPRRHSWLPRRTLTRRWPHRRPSRP